MNARLVVRTIVAADSGKQSNAFEGAIQSIRIEGFALFIHEEVLTRRFLTLTHALISGQSTNDVIANRQRTRTIARWPTHYDRSSPQIDIIKQQSLGLADEHTCSIEQDQQRAQCLPVDAAPDRLLAGTHRAQESAYFYLGIDIGNEGTRTIFALAGHGSTLNLASLYPEVEEPVERVILRFPADRRRRYLVEKCRDVMRRNPLECKVSRSLAERHEIFVARIESPGASASLLGVNLNCLRERQHIPVKRNAATARRAF